MRMGVPCGGRSATEFSFENAEEIGLGGERTCLGSHFLFLFLARFFLFGFKLWHDHFVALDLRKEEVLAARAGRDAQGGCRRWRRQRYSSRGSVECDSHLRSHTQYPNVMKIQALGHVVLKVRNLDRAVAFYSDALGLRLAARQPIRGTPMAFFAIAGNHHDLAVMEVGERAISPPEDSIGLAHFALKIGNGLEELRSARDHLTAKGIRIERIVDHHVSQSLYLRDPDDNTIELYVDADPSVWQADAARVAHSEPLAL